MLRILISAPRRLCIGLVLVCSRAVFIHATGATAGNGRPSWPEAMCARFPRLLCVAWPPLCTRQASSFPPHLRLRPSCLTCHPCHRASGSVQGLRLQHTKGMPSVLVFDDVVQYDHDPAPTNPFSPLVQFFCVVASRRAGSRLSAVFLRWLSKPVSWPQSLGFYAVVVSFVMLFR